MWRMYLGAVLQVVRTGWVEAVVGVCAGVGDSGGSVSIGIDPPKGEPGADEDAAARSDVMVGVWPNPTRQVGPYLSHSSSK